MSTDMICILKMKCMGIILNIHFSGRMPHTSYLNIELELICTRCRYNSSSLICYWLLLFRYIKLVIFTFQTLMNVAAELASVVQMLPVEIVQDLMNASVLMALLEIRIVDASRVVSWFITELLCLNNHYFLALLWMK